jgi:hypothetical protein
VEKKMKQHGWHGTIPVPPTPPAAPAPPAPPGNNEHPEALTEGTVHESRLLEDWEIKDKTGINRGDAIQNALREAQKKVVVFLLEQSPQITWVPPTEYIEEHLVTDKREKEIDPVPGDPRFVGMGKIPAVDMKLEIHDDQLGQIRNIDHGVRVNGRLVDVARLLAIVVAALAGVSGYIRADLWSKGSYTNLLRLGLIAGLALVSIGVWHLPL